MHERCHIYPHQSRKLIRDKKQLQEIEQKVKLLTLMISYELEPDGLNQEDKKAVMAALRLS